MLVTHGYAAFTSRRVAEAAGMAVGNLTYYFPSKRELLRALIARLLRSYAQRFETFLTDSKHSPAVDLEMLVRWVWTDAIDVDTTRTFRELWALALHDVVIRRAIDDFYDEAMSGVVRLLKHARPHASILELVPRLVDLIAPELRIATGTSDNGARQLVASSTDRAP